MTTTASEYARVAVPSVSKLKLVSRSTTLVGGDSGAPPVCACAGTEYPFSLAFPSFIDGQDTLLPPSFYAVQPGACSDVSYAIEVSVLRKGLFRRHEV